MAKLAANIRDSGFLLTDCPVRGRDNGANDQRQAVSILGIFRQLPGSIDVNVKSIFRKSGSHVAILGSTLFLASCSFSSDSLIPALTGDDEAAPEAVAETSAESVAISDGAEEAPVVVAEGPATPPPALGASDFSVEPVTASAPTGTYVGKQVEALRSELAALQSQINNRNGRLQGLRGSATSNAVTYHSTIAGVMSRLQTGTTPGNPELIAQWNNAQLQLERVMQDLGALNNLSNDVAADSAMANFLLEKARASLTLSGAVDQDHANIRLLEDQTAKTVVLIDRLLRELSDDIKRQSSYVANERGNLQNLSLAIKNGELYGQSLGNRALQAAARQIATGQPQQAAPAGNRPLVMIRFDQPNVDYAQGLYTALSQALQQRPNALFDVVAVTPSAGAAADVAIASSRARRYSEEVIRSMTDMGLPGNRISLNSTQSPQASVPEVHIYLR